MVQRGIRAGLVRQRDRAVRRRRRDTLRVRHHADHVAVGVERATRDHAVLVDLHRQPVLDVVAHDGDTIAGARGDARRFRLRRDLLRVGDGPGQIAGVVVGVAGDLTQAVGFPNLAADAVVAVAHMHVRAGIRRQGGRISYWQREYQQSASDADGISLADYIHAFYFFLMQANIRDVLMIGCGGGNLATMLWKSGVDVTVVDIEPRAFAIAHKYFAMPAEIPTHVADGIQWLKGHRRRYGAALRESRSYGAE